MSGVRRQGGKGGRIVRWHSQRDGKVARWQFGKGRGWGWVVRWHGRKEPFIYHRTSHFCFPTYHSFNITNKIIEKQIRNLPYHPSPHLSQIVNSLPSHLSDCATSLFSHLFHLATSLHSYTFATFPAHYSPTFPCSTPTQKQKNSSKIAMFLH